MLNFLEVLKVEKVLENALKVEKAKENPLKLYKD